jgi:UDP-GlcNAc:undecaprenyl-phosphate GlcNAc-1-phosphate transferase
MYELIVPFLTALIVTLLTTPITIKFAKKYKLVNDPKKINHPKQIQNRIIPRAGGLSVFIGLMTAIFFFIPFDKHIIGIILATLLLLSVGLLDDVLEDFSPLKRWLLQFIAAGIVVASGVGISFITNPFGGVIRLDGIVFPINFLGTHNIILIADIFALLWIVWMMNMINWAKGVDGQMPGITTVAATTIGFVSLGFYNLGDPNQLPIAMLSFITAGASLGLLVFNWHPSRILPGFSASTILGFMIAVLSILSGAKLATAVLVLLIPSIDFFYTFSRRLLSGKSPFKGDREHLHHLLLDKKGWSHQQISLFYIASCAILGLLATTLSSQGKLFTAIAVGVIVIGGILWLHFFSTSLKQQDPDNG